MPPARPPVDASRGLIDRLSVLVLDADGPVDEAPDWRISVRSTARADPIDHLDVHVDITFGGARPVDRSLRFQVAFPGSAADRLIPACLYGENRFERCTRRYPRFDPRGGDPLELVSASWSFRADRASVPAVFAWSDDEMLAIAADECSELGLNGLGTSGALGQPALIWLDAPFRETPRVHDGTPHGRAPNIQLHRWQPGERRTMTFRLYAAGPDRHGYDPVIRAEYRRAAPQHPLRPWVSTADAAELAAWGLRRWHYRAEHRALYETAGFDREAGGGTDRLDRPRMHVGWVSGTPYAAALLAYGRRTGDDAAVDAGTNVIDLIATGIAPSGLTWGEWRRDQGWGAGWNSDPDRLHVRTIGDATLFMIRALVSERELGVDHPAWLDSIRSNLLAIVRAQAPDGNLGTYHLASTGEVVEWDGAGGLIWIPALLEARALFGAGDPDLPVQRLLDAALRAGEHYARYVEQELIYGAPEDIHLAPSSEDGYNAVMAYVALHEAAPGDTGTAGRRSWLDLARRSADWMLTFRWIYDSAFDDRTILGRYDFRSRGADGASPSNQHLGGYGLMCLPELLRLADHAADPYYRDRALDNLACYRQFIARVDGDFGAYRGMVTERLYHTDCFQAKGMVLTLSHAWSVGAVLYGAETALRMLEDPDAVP